MDTMEWTKIVAGICGAWLLYMLINTGAGAMYSVGGGGHGGGHGDEAHASTGFVIEVAETTGGGEAEEGPSLEELLASADVGKGEKVFGKCKACHKLEDGANGTGPHLFAVYDRAIGGVGGFGYSGGMAGHGGNWDAANLDAFLEKPKDFISDTKMSFAGLKKPADRANLIAYLQTVQ